MYNYREMTAEERRRVVEDRRRKHVPWHSPPHLEVLGEASYLVTAACYDHQTIVGLSPERISECEEGVLKACLDAGARVYAWCVLPNHYHVLTRTGQIKALLKALGQFHGRSSFTWNGQDQQRGRHCWFNAFDRYIRSDRHFFASLNYVHHNPVHHGYVEKWLDWPWSSASEFIEQNGRNQAARLWNEYPLLDYGKKWDVY
jgi:putative transposase